MREGMVGRNAKNEHKSQRMKINEKKKSEIEAFS